MRDMLNNSINKALMNESIKNIINKFLDKLDQKSFKERSNTLSIFLHDKVFIELSDPSYNEAELELEEEIRILEKEGVFSFPSNSKELFSFIESKKKVIFNEKFEVALREYFNRTINNSTYEDILEKYCDKDSELFRVLKINKFAIPSKSNDEIIKKLFIWINSDKKSSSQKQESARCFWAMSKVFDDKNEFNNYFNLLPLAIHLTIHAKNKVIKDILFIENLDTFNSCCDSSNNVFDNILLVYSSGYKTSAKRIRERAGSKMFFENSEIIENKDEFISWFYKENDLDFKAYIWSDLDYAGIGILNSLKVNFTNLEAWKIAFEAMHKNLNNDLAHSAKMAFKDKQKEIIVSSCFYTNNKSIPNLKEKDLFLDQEFIDINLL
ncbi:MAG: hypothetical protein HRT40_07735 [Campylobacteraceae bacterium]|nr:hypothetical protein [Campylobacteraceae bacterium]